MKFKALALTGLLTGTMLLTAPCYAERAPRPGSADGRVKTLTYHENDVYRLKGHYGYSTAIEFSARENIETISIGDSESWQVIKPSRPNILFVKPLEPNAQTNMTIFTTEHVYTFEMAAGNADSPDATALTFRLKFLYPEQNVFEPAGAENAAHGLKAKRPVSDWNFNYAYAGDNSLRPERVFDDGTFTYFQFREQSVLPAVFAVDRDGNESLVNFTMQGAYLVVNSTGRQFTLRDGDTATCIFNESYPEVTGTQDKISALQEIKEAKSGTNHVPVPGRKPGKQPSLLAWLTAHGAQPAPMASLND